MQAAFKKMFKHFLRHLLTLFFNLAVQSLTVIYNRRLQNKVDLFNRRPSLCPLADRDGQRQ
jgi:hypothetical protein